VSGRINKLTVDVEGGQTRLVVKYFEPMDGLVVSELEYAAMSIMMRTAAQATFDDNVVSDR
jgi:hypothetical protein